MHVLEKCDFGESLTVQRTSKKFEITNIDSTLLRSVSDLDRGQPSLHVDHHSEENLIKQSHKTLQNNYNFIPVQYQ